MTTSLVISCIALGVATANLLFPVKEWMQHWFPWLSPQHDQNEVHHPTMLVEEVESLLDNRNHRVTRRFERFIREVLRSPETENLALAGQVHTT